MSVVGSYGWCFVNVLVNLLNFVFVMLLFGSVMLVV